MTFQKIQPVFHMICGLPGAGKSTLAKKIEQDSPAFRINADTWINQLGLDPHDEAKRNIIEGLQWAIVRNVLSLGISAILDNGFWSKEERARYAKEAADLGAYVKLYYLSISKDVQRERLIKRNDIPSSEDLFTDPALIDEWHRVFEPPVEEEVKHINGEFILLQLSH